MMVPDVAALEAKLLVLIAGGAQNVKAWWVVRVCSGVHGAFTRVSGPLHVSAPPFSWQ
jgi:hypothetical protein